MGEGILSKRLAWKASNGDLVRYELQVGSCSGSYSLKLQAPNDFELWFFPKILDNPYRFCRRFDYETAHTAQGRLTCF
jgi:hypothetical protein